MDTTDFLETVRESRRTELSRLGSSKSLFADTAGDLEPEPVLSAAADTFGGAAEIVADWTSGHGDEAAVFEEFAEDQRANYETVMDRLDDHEVDDRPAVSATLADFETPAERLGGLVGWTLVVRKKANQLTGFFTGQADPQTAGVFREFGDDLDEAREAVLDALAHRDDAGREAALAAADRVIEAAYDEYVRRLEDQGVNPKPVC